MIGQVGSVKQLIEAAAACAHGKQAPNPSLRVLHRCFEFDATMDESKQMSGAQLSTLASTLESKKSNGSE